MIEALQASVMNTSLAPQKKARTPIPQAMDLFCAADRTHAMITPAPTGVRSERRSASLCMPSSDEPTYAAKAESAMRSKGKKENMAKKLMAALMGSP